MYIYIVFILLKNIKCLISTIKIKKYNTIISIRYGGMYSLRTACLYTHIYYIGLYTTQGVIS